MYGIYAIFKNAVSFNGNISNWDVSNIKYMEKMFLGAKSFNQDLNNWNVSNAVSMEYMFYNASSFDKENIKEWQLNNLKYISNMFNDIPLYIIFKVYSNINFKKALKELKKYTSDKDIKEVYSMALKYYDKCVIEFVKFYENTYYDELKELIENKEKFIKENSQLLKKSNKLDKKAVYKPKK